MALDMASLDDRIAGLAQELQDMILDHTLIATAQASPLPEIVITNDYRPPWQICLDSRSRKEFAKWYYRHNIFRINCVDKFYDPAHKSVREDLAVWLLSLPKLDRSKVLNIRLFEEDTFKARGWLQKLHEIPGWYKYRLTRAKKETQEARVYFEEKSISLQRGTIKAWCILLEATIKGDTDEKDTVSGAWLSEEDAERKIHEYEAKGLTA